MHMQKEEVSKVVVTRFYTVRTALDEIACCVSVINNMNVLEHSVHSIILRLMH